MRFAAFLRAINVGKRRVKMDALRAHFEALGFDEVRTLLASGNVVFEAEAADGARIAEALEARLGWPVPTAVVDAAALGTVAERDPFELAEGDVLHVSFLVEDPADVAAAAVSALSNEEDRLLLEGRTLYWRRRGRLSDSPLDTKALDRAVGVPHTSRRMDTVRKTLALLGGVA